MSTAPETPWRPTHPAAPVAAKPGRHFGAKGYLPAAVGVASVVALLAVVALAVALFRGDFNKTVPLTVLSDRAGLLMNPGGRVKLNGGQVGTVANVTETSDGRAAIKLAIDEDRFHLLPANVQVQIGAATVFGAKSVEFTSPSAPSSTMLQAGQVLDSEHVTVEVNTIFEQLNSVLGHIDPAKLNETLGALSTGFSGRGEAFGRTLTDFNSFLVEVEPSLPQLSRDLQTLPVVANAYADAAPDLMGTIKNFTRISQTLVDEKSSLDQLLVSATGLADIGNDVIGTNQGPLANLMHLLAPTTDLTNEYHEALNCSLIGILPFALRPPGPNPGVTDLATFTLGLERYRYDQDLPKVAASGPPQCAGQLPLPFETFPNKVIMDTGVNPYKYGNQGPLLNSDALKQFLFGPIDGPPRNTAQIGQPG